MEWQEDGTMIIVTGGAGCIGSATVWALNTRGRQDILIVDRLGKGEKWKNLVSLQYRDFIQPDDFLRGITSGTFTPAGIEAVVHLGACSSTTETDADYLMSNNYAWSVSLAEWCLKHDIRLVYASSAATYGDGGTGYHDDPESARSLKPLNMYGYSKHAFDLHAINRGWLHKMAGLKFFNVFGPNEYHKGDMRSVVLKAWSALNSGSEYPLFRSHREGYADGEQRRDFVWLKDVTKVILFFLDHPDINGIFNVGSGTASSFNQLLTAVFDAMGKPPSITYIDMPLHLRDRYQYYTCADISRLRSVGYDSPCTPLEEAVREYVQEYLAQGKHLS